MDVSFLLSINTRRAVVSEQSSVVVLFPDPILGFSQLLPDGVFSLILGTVLLVGGVFLYWSETDSDG
jgi:hypothetical protein